MNYSDAQFRIARDFWLVAAMVFFSAAPAAAETAASFWNPARETAAALEDLQPLAANPSWRSWWLHLQGDRLLAMARGQAPVDRALLIAVCKQLEHPAARSEPQFFALHAALLDWRVELALPTSGPVPPLVRTAAERFRPSTSEELRSLVKATRLAAARTAASLQGPYAQGWREYLRLAELARLADSPDPKSLPALEEIYRRMSASHTGLDRRAITQVRLTVGRLLDALEAVHNPSAAAEHARKMLELATALEELEHGPNPSATQIVTETLDWLERSERRRPFAYAVRRQFTWPNVYLDVSADFVRQASATPFDRTERVTDQIQDISISGSRTARGNVWFELVPNPQAISFDVRMEGHSVARTVGSVQRARIHSDTTASFTAQKRVQFDGREITHDPATAEVEQWSKIRCVAVDVIRLLQRFATRLAWRKTLERKPTVDRISREHTHEQVRDEFDRELRQEIAKTGQLFQAAVWGPLERYDEFPRHTQLATTHQAIEFRALLADVQSAGALAPPPPKPSDAGVTLRVHESALSYAARRLSDRNWPEGELTAALDELLAPGAVPPRTPNGAVFNFADDHALSVSFAGNEVHISLRLEEVAIGGRRFNDLRVEAVYDVSNLADHAQLVRRGPLQIEPVEVHLNGEKLPELEAAVRELLQKHLEGAFPAVAEPQPPAWWRKGRVVLRRIAVDHGWLVLTWDARPADPQP
ncbi:MAG: hypothetical protein U0836_14340 [Pirellulales bacterium]